MFVVAAGSLVGAHLALPTQAIAEADRTLAVLPFELDDNSGEQTPLANHNAMLQSLRRTVEQQIAERQLYRIVPEKRIAEAIATVNSGTYLRSCNGCEIDIARIAGADRVLIGWIFKMSSLVLTLHVVMKSTVTGKIIYARAFDFRGDNERAWRHAAGNFVRSLAQTN